jgi:hypothetical protein
MPCSESQSMSLSSQAKSCRSCLDSRRAQADSARRIWLKPASHMSRASVAQRVSLALHGARGDALHKTALEGEEDDEQRNDADHRHSHLGIVVGQPYSAAELEDGQW